MYEKFYYRFIYACSIHQKKLEFLSFGKPFLDPLIYLLKVKIFAENDKFTSKIDIFFA